MAKSAFRVEDGLIPGHTSNDLGHTAAKFRDVHISRNTNVGNNLSVSGNTTTDGLTANGTTILPNFSGGGGGGGGVTIAQSIAFAIALG